MHLLYFWTSLLAVVAFAPAMLSPGYLLAYAMNLYGFRRLRWPEQALWSIALSSPLAILLSVYGGLLLGNIGVGAAFLVLLFVAAVVRWRAGTGGVPAGWLQQKPIRVLSLVVAGTAAYLLLAGAPLEFRGRLMEGVASADWSVRVPLIGAAIRTGMPLVNPFYAVGGQVGPLRYYMYWYALCGVIGRTAHLPARAVMEAGCAWASVLMFATLFLLLKYLFRPAPEWPAMRWATVCVGCVCAMPILGWDVLQAIYGMIVVPVLYPEVEWWRAYAGFSPSFHTFLLYAPHHAFGVCAGFTGMLLLCAPRLSASPEGGASPARRCGLAGVAGLCFGAVAGTSTYVALFLALACALLAVESLLRRDRLTVLTIAVCGIAALAGAGYFAHLMLGNPVRGGDAFLGFSLRGWTSTIDWFDAQFVQRGHTLPGLWAQWPAITVLWLLLLASEAGVFLVVLVYRIRSSFFSGRRLLPEERIQWLLLLSFFVFALFVTSAGTIVSNDLGYHAGFVLRVVAVLWTAPWIVTLWKRRERRRAFFASWTGRLALALVAVGVATQVWQMALQRFVLLAPGGLHRYDGPFPGPPSLAHQYEEVYRAWQAVDRTLPQRAAVLTNPDSPQRSLATLYSNRQMVAPEPKCMAAFGGDPKACRQALPALRTVFGESPFGAPQSETWTGADGSAFAAACALQHAAAVLVSADDAVWNQRTSWVWRQQPVYAGTRERLFLCPEVTRSGSR